MNEKPRVFHYQNLEIETHPEVYEPAEDTFLLLETVRVTAGDRVLELGTGCGVIALACARVGAHVICTDVNPWAVETTRRNILRNHHVLKGSVEVRHGHLFSVLQPHERFDVVVFNPPYLPTRAHERVGGWFDVAVDGGPDGLHITKQFLSDLPKYLMPRGQAYFLFSSLADRSTLEHYLDEHRFAYDILAGYVFDNEEINVYGVTPKP